MRLVDLHSWAIGVLGTPIGQNAPVIAHSSGLQSVHPLGRIPGPLTAFSQALNITEPGDFKPPIYKKSGTMNMGVIFSYSIPRLCPTNALFQSFRTLVWIGKFLKGCGAIAKIRPTPHSL